MRTLCCAFVPLLAAAPLFGGCAGTRQVPSAEASGGAGPSGAGGGGPSATGTGGSTALGSGGSASGNGSGGDGDVGGLNCGLQQFKPTPKAADILMVLDRSGSMVDIPNGAPAGSTTTKWDLVVPSLEQVVGATAASISWGMKSFPETYTDSMSDCGGGVTNAIDVQVTTMNAAAMNAAITALTPAGKGTPTADAITAGVTYLKTLSDANPKYLLLATDGEPTCVGTSKDSSNAGPAAVTAIGNALAAGFPTFVVGIATSKTSASSELNAMAQAGGVAVPDVNPLANHYYVADDAASLVSSLQAITGQISTCLFPLDPPPPVLNDPSKLGVYVGAGMTKVPYDDQKANGWTFTDANDSAVQVYGPWCDMIQNAGAGEVQIIFGCPQIDVP